MVDDAGQQMMAFHRRRGKISVINYRRQVVLYMMISFLTRMLTVFHIFKQTPPLLLLFLPISITDFPFLDMQQTFF